MTDKHAEYTKELARLDQLGAELIMRAASLDALAEQLDRHAVLLDRREREVEQRELDVLNAAAEIWGKEDANGLTTHH